MYKDFKKWIKGKLHIFIKSHNLFKMKKNKTAIKVT